MSFTEHFLAEVQEVARRLDTMQPDEVGCQIITATPDILKKLTLVGKERRSIRSIRPRCSERMR